ncbi:MAG: Spo0B C-terminal domain-containing protein [Bacillota bacterium]|jgi:stage 0 sporulation protein B (sporulation initiation phosphotransferase)|nr:Spo0B C-terminal domain-containing protein [Bacillota bacterium]
MEKEWNMIEVLRHSRHDWLNKLQLIKGNLDLNRIDRAKAIIDEIVIEAQHETKLSNLHIPLFASLLIRANWESNIFTLEYEVLQESGLLYINELALTQWTEGFFTCLNESITALDENHLAISIDSQDDGARFFFDFSGIIKQKARIEKFLTDCSVKDLELTVKEFSEHELAIEVFLPLNNR